MADHSFYLPDYTESRALVIGINKYKFASPLIQACNDAQAVAGMLVERFSFPKKNVELLLDAKATRAAILRAFMQFANPELVGTDDRILVFFAGHGHTVPGRRGETGFLVPVDGKIDDLATLIRWDELTRNAELIAAKHMLFLMDACYGGLALKRKTIPPGSTRFLKDMLQRYTRQVLSAGKADEAVADSGGTRTGHSIFTSHLLDGMDGAAMPSGGTLTGHGLMAYVYDKVGNDPQSHQTPHFGFVDGDGDFIFDTSILGELKAESSSEPGEEHDVLIKIPSFGLPETPPEETVSDILKRLIANPGDRIRLDSFISDLLRRATEKLRQGNFPTDGQFTGEEFALRLQRYEDAIADLQVAVILLAHWAEPEQIKLLEKIFARIAEADKPTAGHFAWIKLAWYPVFVLMYAAGISALAAGRYDTLKTALMTPVHSGHGRSSHNVQPVAMPVIEDMTEIIEAFKKLPDMAQKYVPRSEHIFKKLQPVLEDELFLGRSYEALFDEFEILLALSFSNIRDDNPAEHAWGPPGRFAWKERGRFGDPVYTNYVSDAKAQGEKWKPLAAGLFNGSAKRFAAIADGYSKVLARVNWW